MATSSRLKTADGKYYATEEFVDRKIEESTISGNIKDAISDEVTEKLSDVQTLIDEKANLSSTYTKIEVDEKIDNFLTMHSI